MWGLVWGGGVKKNPTNKRMINFHKNLMKISIKNYISNQQILAKRCIVTCLSINCYIYIKQSQNYQAIINLLVCRRGNFIIHIYFWI